VRDGNLAQNWIGSSAPKMTRRADARMQIFTRAVSRMQRDQCSQLFALFSTDH